MQIVTFERAMSEIHRRYRSQQRGFTPYAFLPGVPPIRIQDAVRFGKSVLLVYATAQYFVDLADIKAIGCSTEDDDIPAGL